jgi:hypothetical protein
MERERKYLIVHGYFEYPSKQPQHPDINCRLQLLAANELWKKGEVDVFVFPTGVGDPTIGERMAGHLQKINPHIPAGTLYVANPTIAGTTTITETEVAKKIIAMDEHPKRISSIGRRWHIQRLQRDVNREFKTQVTVYSSDEVLAQADQQHKSHRYSHILDNWQKSDCEAAIMRREQLVNKIDAIPVVGKLLIKTVNKITNGSRDLNKALLRLGEL